MYCVLRWGGGGGGVVAKRGGGGTQEMKGYSLPTGHRAVSVDFQNVVTVSLFKAKKEGI